MKKILTLMAIAILALSQWVNANPKATLTGTWELEYAIYKNQKNEVVGEIKDKSTLSRKILSEQHFAFITWDKSGKFTVAASGTYTFKGENYSETIDVTSEARLMGKTYHFNGVIKKDLWIHKGMEDGILIEEHWRRVH
ncbi:hypothetical protein [Cellvibrio fibrivorans]|jgi:hypothetical protein|uniref:Lipocalin-like domain-containing protein n=1 Tax=Cellvibrio fibrivorans TaxID=126350 RepID=A0ABU1UT97_9GAMM|nr:hypothetical protein [Cellvibrio fibrivorans]MDR7088412.1 hypothetical protein [Cellvibrio fibrivorans]